MYQSLWRHSSNAVVHISPQTFLHKCPMTWHNPVQALHDGPITRVLPAWKAHCRFVLNAPDSASGRTRCSIAAN